VVVSGDGGLMMSIQELETAVRERIPLTVVVLNDGAYAAEARHLEARGKPTDLAVFGDVDFAAVARGFGARAVTVRTLDDLQEVRTQLGARDRPLLIDAKVTEAGAHRSN
jgi:thiamine pyrophosphate-dependent acetolactate synthase large subunit-like protein